MRALGLIALALVLSAGVASARPSADPGVSQREILIGGTIPLSGIAASYASVGRGAEAYFKYVNARGGVNGRRINYKYVDDQYNPSQTVQAVRELVQQDRVFAIFNALGTEHNLAVRSFLNASRVPQLFAGSGATTFGRDHRRYPYTIGYLPSYVGEGKVYARHIRATKPNAKVAVLYQNDDYGRDLLNGFRAGMGPKRGNIAATQGYDPLSTDVASQIARLRSSGATVLLVIATPPFAIRGLVAANRLGWRPQVYINQVGSATTIMRTIALDRQPAHRRRRDHAHRDQGPADAALPPRQGHGAVPVDHAPVPSGRQRQRRLPRLLDGRRAHVRDRAAQGRAQPDAGEHVARRREPERAEQPVRAARRRGQDERERPLPARAGTASALAEQQWLRSAK